MSSNLQSSMPSLLDLPSGATRLVGLLGGDVRHSLSVLLHNHALAVAGLDWRYVALPVAPDDLEAAVHGLRAMGFAGFNVTMPHKQTIIPLLDELTDEASRMGAVNTVRIDSAGRMTGGNTDGPGFLEDLRAHDVRWDRPIHVLGAGGAARAVTVALARHGSGPITIVNRTRSRANSLAELVRDLTDVPVDTLPWPDGVTAAPSDALVVNCTCVGMTGTDVEGHNPWPGDVEFATTQTVVDLVYAPEQTPLLRHADACGAGAIGGIGMLVHQAALAYGWWTGSEPPVETMRAALEAR